MVGGNTESPANLRALIIIVDKSVGVSDEWWASLMVETVFNCLLTTSVNPLPISAKLKKLISLGFCSI